MIKYQFNFALGLWFWQALFFGKTTNDHFNLLQFSICLSGSLTISTFSIVLFNI